MKKETRKLLGQIEALAKHDPEGAEDLAAYGRKRSPLERALWFYLYAMTMKNPQLEAQWAAEALCELFLQAVDKRDDEALHRLAGEVKSFRKSFRLENPIRARILVLKNILDARGDKMPVSKLAGLLNRKLAGDPVKIPKTADGHACLRRLCKGLKFPLAKVKRGPKSRPVSEKTRRSKS